jgi:acetylornithine deacetylase/succinyl-diaminopimelate desuccinylase-like protein
MIATERIYRQWDEEIVPRLVDYIRIPSKSPHFDPAWQAHGHIERVIGLAEDWARAQPIAGLAVEIVRLPGRTPLLFFEVPGHGENTVLLYGHLDKQPEMIGWRADGGPWSPLIDDGKLYGRGAADDGYAIFAALSALGALSAQGVPHARCVGLIETCEESGSYDLPAYLAALTPRIGNVDFVVGLDSGCGDYERLWMTTSLRGLAAGALTVDVLT